MGPYSNSNSNIFIRNIFLYGKRAKTRLEISCSQERRAADGGEGRGRLRRRREGGAPQPEERAAGPTAAAAADSSSRCQEALAWEDGGGGGGEEEQRRAHAGLIEERKQRKNEKNLVSWAGKEVSVFFGDGGEINDFPDEFLEEEESRLRWAFGKKDFWFPTHEERRFCGKVCSG